MLMVNIVYGYTNVIFISQNLTFYNTLLPNLCLLKFNYLTFVIKYYYIYMYIRNH